MSASETPPPSRLVPLGLALAGAGPAVAGCGAALANAQLVAPMTGFGVFLVSGPISIAAVVVGLLGMRKTERTDTRRRRRAIAASTIGGAVVLGLVALLAGTRGAPPINDITTDTTDPPGFVALAKVPANAGRDMTYPKSFAEQQADAYPDVKPLQSALQPIIALERASRTARALGWDVVDAEGAGGARLEATETSHVFRFVDDVTIRVRPDASGSIVDIRSKSRDGRSDLGVNAKRIRAFAAEFRSD